MGEVAFFACSWEGKELLKKLIELGVEVNDQENGGSSLIERILHHMSWNFRSGAWGSRPGPEGLDTSEAREGIDLIKFLAEHRARWVPKDDRELNSIRRSLLKLVPKYTLDFVSVMARHQACCRATMQSLLRTGSMKKHTANHAGRIAKLVASLPEAPQSASA
jgi:hypothetical protein